MIPIKRKTEWKIAGGWTAERVEIAMQKHREGLSMSQIARFLGNGITRSAVIAKLSRLAPSRQHGARSKPALTVLHKHGGARFLPSWPALPADKAPDVRLLATEPEPIGPVRDLVKHGEACQWIHGHPNTGTDWRCCGHEVIKPGENYCPFHFDRSINPEASARFRRTWGLAA